MRLRFSTASIFTSLCVVLSPSFSQTTTVYLRAGFLTGNVYVALDRDDKRAYLMGLMDGALLAPMFDAPRREMRWLENCIDGINGGQLAAVVDKWMADNPIAWTRQMNTLFLSAMRESCKR